MRLGIRILNNTSTLNGLFYANQAIINPGETFPVFFQLVDLDLMGGANCPPQRYIPITGATMSIQLVSIDNSKTITKIPFNPFPEDRSIWAFNLSSSDTQMAAGINMKVMLTEGTNIKIAIAEAVIIIGPRSPYCC